MKIGKAFFALVSIILIVSVSACTPEKNNVLGLWRDDNGDIYLHLKNDGSVSLKIASAQYAGEYSVKDHILSIKLFNSEKIFGKSEIKWTYIVSGDALTLKFETGETVLTRVHVQ